MTNALFDTWTDRYDSWFATPTGQWVRKYEAELLLAFLTPGAGERILDVGCGTGIFTQDVADCGAQVTGVDRSCPMLGKAVHRLRDTGFTALCADMRALPFADNTFDRVFSMTAIEFVADAALAIAELHRVVRKGGRVVVTTLNSRSPWAEQRQRKAQAGHDLFQHIFFRSPEDMRRLVPEPCRIETAIHFQKNDSVETLPEIERNGRANRQETGAFLAVQWTKTV